MSRSTRALVIAAYVLVFWLALPAGLWWLAQRIDAAAAWQRSPISALGALFLVPGLGLMVWAMAALWTRGGGLPVSALPPPRFVVTGPYRHCRHPIYLGFNLAVAGAGLATGSWGLVILSVAFAPVWVAYGLVEERGLRRRFGQAWVRHRRQVGLLPRWGVYRLTQLLVKVRVFPVKVTGKVPRRGGVILVANHSCYLDPVFVGAATCRPVHYLTTSEAYRQGVMGVAVRRFVNVPVRRYRPDPVAAREVLRLLSEGEVVGIFSEGERSILGNFQGALPGVARIVRRAAELTGARVVPIGVSGAFDAGPRWAETVRRRLVRVRVGSPINWGGDPSRDIDAAILDLVEEDPQRVHVQGLDLGRLDKVLWRCPRCLAEEGWLPADLRCACGARWAPTDDGLFRAEDGAPLPLSELARPCWEAPEREPLKARAVASWERSMFGPILPLARLGEGDLQIDSQCLRFGDLILPLDRLRSTSTERADTLQVATSESMWQFRLSSVSAFRFQWAIDRWRGGVGVGGDPFLREHT